MKRKTLGTWWGWGAEGRSQFSMIEREGEGSPDPKRSFRGQDVSLLCLPPGGQVMFEKKSDSKARPRSGSRGGLGWATEPPHRDVNSSSVTMNLGRFLYHLAEPRFPDP